MIESYIKRYAQLMPSKTFFIIDGIEYSYSFVDLQVNKYANLFRNTYNVTEQNCIILRAERNIDFLCCYFALHCLNVIVLPVDENILSTSLKYIINEVTPLYVIGSTDEDTISYATLRTQIGDILPIDELSLIDNECIADIMFTSGTTGSPKGVKLSHRNIESSAINISKYVGNKMDDIEILALPLCHSFGLGRIRSTLVQGGTIIFHNGFSNVKSLLKLIETSNATGFSMVPAGWNIIKKFSGSKLSKYGSKLRYIEMGSSYMSSSEKSYLAELLPNTRICMHYGLTEASRSSFMEFHEDNLESVGKPLPGVNIKIHYEGKLTTDENVEGEICINGNHVTPGYWNFDDNSEFYIDNYIRTGDIGYIQSGYLYISGRLKDLINIGGKKVSAKEIEDLTLTIDSIKECACIGIDDNVLGEVPALFIVPEDTKTIDRDFILTILSSNLEEYKIPRIIKIVSSLPKTGNGKIKKFELVKLC